MAARSASGLAVQRDGRSRSSALRSGPDCIMWHVQAPGPLHTRPKGSHGLHIVRAAVQVSLSSLNRHAVATRADVGLPKATVLKRHFATILPEVPLSSRRDIGADRLGTPLLAAGM